MQRNREEKPTSFSLQSTDVMVAPFGASRIACALAICSVAASPELVLAMPVDPRLQDASPIKRQKPLFVLLERIMAKTVDNLFLARFAFLEINQQSRMYGQNDSIQNPAQCLRLLATVSETYMDSSPSLLRLTDVPNQEMPIGGADVVVEKIEKWLETNSL